MNLDWPLVGLKSYLELGLQFFFGNCLVDPLAAARDILLLRAGLALGRGRLAAFL